MPTKDLVKRRRYHNEWYQRNAEARKQQICDRRVTIRDWFNQYKSSLACTTCGENHPATFDFHHLDPKEKDDGVATLVRNALGKDRILAEIAKCKVLCANCHRKLHYEERRIGACSGNRTHIKSLEG